MADSIRYEIQRLIGKGGFGAVYRAREVHPDGREEEVALKVAALDSANAALEVERLRDEARILEQLDHRAIVKVKRLTQLSGRWTIVLEYVAGANLKQALGVECPPPGAALAIIAECADALHHAYEKRGPTGRRLRLLHRDIKPQNIILSQSGQVKLLDFGIARASVEGRESVTLETRFGSFAYMAPERYDSVEGPAGDVYALGCLLYELLTGEAFGRTSANRLKHEEQRRSALTLLEMTLSDPEDDEDRVDALRELVDLCGACLQFVADDRPEEIALARRARALVDDLGGEPLAVWAPRVLAELPEPGQEASSGDLLEGDLLGEGGPQPLGGAVGILEAGLLESRTAEEMFVMSEEPAPERAAQPSTLGLNTGEEPASGEEPEPFDADAPTSVPTGADLGVEAVDYWEAAAAAASLFKAEDDGFPVRPYGADAEPSTHQVNQPSAFLERGYDEPVSQPAGQPLPRFKAAMPDEPVTEPGTPLVPAAAPPESASPGPPPRPGVPSAATPAPVGAVPGPPAPPKPSPALWIAAGALLVAGAVIVWALGLGG